MCANINWTNVSFHTFVSVKSFTSFEQDGRSGRPRMVAYQEPSLAHRQTFRFQYLHSISVHARPIRRSDETMHNQHPIPDIGKAPNRPDDGLN
jgi:hypothetical protein